MKKLIFSLVLTVLSLTSAFAADMSEVWGTIRETKGFFVDEVKPEKAKANGFESLLTAVNTAPTSADINAVNALLATINPKQKVSTVSQQGVEVSVYVAPASADGKMYKLLLAVNKDDNEDKLLAVLYGLSTPQGMIDALQNLSIVDIIGG